jgi:hypothetical protein
MVKIKNWRIFQDTEGITRWINNISFKEVRVAGKTKYSEPIGKWFVELPNRNPIFRDTRKEAMDIAIIYMRSHPNG